jgi:hypothetical protein
MGRHILVVNRFDPGLGCRYDRFIDHRVDRVAYITTAAGRGTVPEELAEAVAVVDDLGDHAAVETEARAIAGGFGAFDHVVALYELDLGLGALLRQRLGVAGPRPEDVLRVRDKVLMKSLVAAAGLRVPRFIAVDRAEDVRAFVAEVGFPVVLKPRDGADSQGIVLVHTAVALEAVLAAPLVNHVCEEFITGVMFQVDGVAQDGEVRVLRSSRLLNTCLEFALGGPFGSVSNDDAALERRLVGYTERVLAALRMPTGVFHLELFLTGEPGDGYADLVFLELGARAGGAEIPHLWRDVYGMDLHEIAVRLALGETPSTHAIDVGGDAVGYLLMPEPPVRPCRVLEARSLVGEVPELYAESLAPAGAVLDGTGGCKEVGGRFRFRAASAGAVERAIREVVDRYELRWEPLPDHERRVSRPVGRAQSVVAAS